MLLMAPLKDRDVLWMVTTTGPKRARLVAHLGYGTVEVTTTTPFIPDKPGWRLVSNTEAIDALTYPGEP